MPDKQFRQNHKQLIQQTGFPLTSIYYEHFFSVAYLLQVNFYLESKSIIEGNSSGSGLEHMIMIVSDKLLFSQQLRFVEVLYVMIIRIEYI